MIRGRWMKTFTSHYAATLDGKSICLQHYQDVGDESAMLARGAWLPS